MSSDKNDEFSLEGLEDLDLDEAGDGLDFSAEIEDEGFELDLSGDDDAFSLSMDGEVVESVAVSSPDEFSLTNANLDISLADVASEDEIQTLEVASEDEIDLGSELKDEFFIGQDSEIPNGIEETPLEDDLFGLSNEDQSLDLSEDDSLNLGEDDGAFSLSEEDGVPELGDENLFSTNESNVSLKDYSAPKIKLAGEDLTEDVKAKLKEIDAIMEEDATSVALSLNAEEDALILDHDLSDSAVNPSFLDDEASEEIDVSDSSLSFHSDGLEEELFSEENAIADESLVGDLNLSSLDLEEEKEEVTKVIDEAPPVVQKKKKKKEESAQSLNEITQAYTGEMERTQATISNLRSDRDELLARIDELEEEKLLNQRSNLTQRAELDEKKIELSIIRRKLNEEIIDLKDKIKVLEERVLIQEEKNKYLQQELDKAGQKNKIDVKKVMFRERELEQKLELLKADAETQIRNRDLKILELKRKIDGMEFDMESITQQEKKTLESRFELEDKLDKAIRTLRTAISSLEENGERSTTLEAIKKNIDM